ncbi:MAG: magnesium transporter [Candidatus Pacearchaeota archaeon]
MKKEKIFCEVCEVMCPAPSVLKNATIRDTIEMLAKRSKVYDSIDYVYVTEENGELIGVFSIKDTFRFARSTPVKKFMITKVVSVNSKTKSEEVADIALKYGIKSIPIVESKKLVGVIPPKKVSKIINDSLRKDIFHFAGIHKSHLEYENTLQVPLLKSVWHRTPWLIIGLVGVIITAALISLFERVLEANLILAFFIPAVVYISGALGNQIQALFIRDLTVMGDKLKTHEYIIKQTAISSIIAIIVALVTFFGLNLFWRDLEIGLIISIAMFTSIMITNFTAFIITYALKKAGKDPALGAGPFATMISDATSIISYLLIASAMI